MEHIFQGTFRDVKGKKKNVGKLVWKSLSWRKDNRWLCSRSQNLQNVHVHCIWSERRTSTVSPQIIWLCVFIWIPVVTIREYGERNRKWPKARAMQAEAGYHCEQLELNIA
jgi:hypothetical protein